MANSNRSAEKEAFWRLVLEEHRGSRLTVRAFCQKEGIAEPSFYAWRKEIAKRDEKCDLSVEQQTLIPVDVVEPGGDAATRCVEGSASRLLEVVTPSGFTLRFHHDIEPQKLNTLFGHRLAQWFEPHQCLFGKASVV